MSPIMEHWDGKVIIQSMDDYNHFPLLMDWNDYLTERWPLMVRYDERGVLYVPRDHFCFEPRNTRCSDCVWIVPGSTP